MSTTTLEDPLTTHGTIIYYDGPSPVTGASDAALSATKLANPQHVLLHDVRPTLSLPHPMYTLDTHGFTVLKHSSVFSSPPYSRASWNDHALREQIHYPEIEELMKNVTGAKKIMIAAGTARTKIHTEPEMRIVPGTGVTTALRHPEFVGDRPRMRGFEAGTEAGPAVKPHIDFGTHGVRTSLRNWRQDIVDEAADIIAAEEDAAKLPGGVRANYARRRWGMDGVWRPLALVRRDPLAYAEWGSVAEEDLIDISVTPMGIHGPFETRSKILKEGEGHKWYWCKDQTPEEVTIIKFFDSDSERAGKSVAGASPHCSIQLAGTEDKPARESIEIRVFAFW